MRLILAVAVLLLSVACVPTLHQPPAPIGQPSPAACLAATEARRAWLTYVEPYVRALLEAQESYSCQPPPPAPIQPPPCMAAGNCGL